jgi:hypothetical protein
MLLLFYWFLLLYLLLLGCNYSLISRIRFMNFLLRLCCCLLFIGLTSCVTQQKTVLQKQNIKQCLVMCETRFGSCKSKCTNNCSKCSASSSFTSATNYKKYVHEEQVEGGLIARGLNSYRDPLQCRKVTCNCNADLMTCTQNCTGVIQKSLRSVPDCT